MVGSVFRMSQRGGLTPDYHVTRGEQPTGKRKLGPEKMSEGMGMLILEKWKLKVGWESLHNLEEAPMCPKTSK